MSAPGSGEQPHDLLAALEASFKRPVSDEAVLLYQLSTNTFVRPIHDDAPTHIALPLSAAAQQERRERAYFRDEPGETRLHLSTYTAGYLACLKDLGLGEWP